MDSGSDSQGDAEGRARTRSRYRPCCGAADTRVPPGGATPPAFLGNSSAPGRLFITQGGDEVLFKSSGLNILYSESSHNADLFLVY